MNVEYDMSVVKPTSTPATSEMKNHSRSFNHTKNGDSTGTEKDPSFPVIVGDCVRLPSALPTKIWLDKKRVTPGAMRLIAIPDTIWSTPNVTVAIAWTRP